MESENAAFWLPSQFLTDEDFLPDIDNAKEMEKENDKYDDEFLSELTRQLARSSLNEKSWNLSTSPQSTLSWLSRNGSPNGASPPLTPPGAKNDAAWDLLYEAATQVARLKMAAQLQNRIDSAYPRHHHHINSFYNNTQQVKRQGNVNAMWGHQQKTQRRTSGGFNTLPHSAWPCTRPGSHQHHLNHRDIRTGPVYLGSGQPVKKPSTGTGVFIPRTFGSHPEPRKSPSVTVPGGVVSALNVDHHQMNNRFMVNNPRFTPTNGADILMARRNAIMNQHRSMRQEMPVTMVVQDVRLPTDWTY